MNTLELYLIDMHGRCVIVYDSQQMNKSTNRLILGEGISYCVELAHLRGFHVNAPFSIAVHCIVFLLKLLIERIK